MATPALTAAETIPIAITPRWLQWSPSHPMMGLNNSLRRSLIPRLISLLWPHPPHKNVPHRPYKMQIPLYPIVPRSEQPQTTENLYPALRLIANPSKNLSVLSTLVTGVVSSSRVNDIAR